MTAPVAPDLLAVSRAAESEDFQRRVKAAMFLTVNKIVATAASGVVDDELAKQGFLAKQIAGNSEMFLEQVAWLCAANPSVYETVTYDEATGIATVSCPDNALLAVLNQAWAALIGK